MDMKQALLYPSFRLVHWAVGLFLTAAAVSTAPVSPAAAASSAHDFAFTSIEGEPMPMAGFEGKAVLLVNTASFCGFTHQYEGLQALWDKYRDRGLVVLGVPSNDFGRQEPGSEEDIKEFCEVNYSIQFPMTEKNVVRGEKAHPLYGWLRSELGAANAPSWNFHKYLIGPDGKAVTAFATHVKPDDRKLTAAIEALLPASD